ncbi:MAG: DNA repair protein RadC [Ruminococcaceae bacterium]|nr:DNA repair protein RadC [Oscillospiraceae bacterium]
MGDENVHAGHRARLKARFRDHGLESFSDIEALELLLFYAIPRADTNELAHALLARFKDFRGVLEADRAALERVPGIGDNAATLLRLVTALNGRYLRAAATRGTPIRDSEAAGAYLLPQFDYRSGECSVLLCLDTADRVIDCHFLGEGTTAMVGVSARELVELALRDKAARVILAHNHVSGVALPSRADVEATGRIYHMLRMIGVELTDHLIFADGDFVSMRDSGHFAGF